MSRPYFAGRMSSNPATRMTNKTLLVVSLVCVLAVSALFDGLFFLHGIYARPASTYLANCVSGILLVMWIVADRDDHPQIGRSFDDGFLLMVFWPPYLPYYLWRTRRGAGLWMLAGFAGLFSLSLFIQLAIWAVLVIKQ